MFKHDGCQLPGKLIVCAYHFEAQGVVKTSYMAIDRIIQYLGRGWKKWFNW